MLSKVEGAADTPGMQQTGKHSNHSEDLIYDNTLAAENKALLNQEQRDQMEITEGQ